MSSERRKTTRRYYAEKKVRKGKKWVFPIVLLFCVLVGLAGAAAIYYMYAPIKYSDAEIDAYVKSNYGDSWTLLRKKEISGEQGGMNAYLYEKKGDKSFSVFSTVVPLEQNGEYTGRTRKAVYDNYYSTVIENRLEEIEDLAKEAQRDKGPELDIEETGESSGAFGAQYVFRLYLEDSSQFGEAASLISEIDELLSFSCKEGKSPWVGMRAKPPCVHVYLKPDRGITGGADAVTRAAKRGSDPGAARSMAVPEDWRSLEVREAYRIGTIPFTDLVSSPRLTVKGLFTRMENDYVDAARTFGKEHYSVSGELCAKYPAPVLKLVNIGGHDLTQTGESAYSYELIYYRKTGTYWMVGLDPCEDFDDNPFGDYPRRGAFANLVRCLGGTFSADDWTGTWRIGTTQWEAVQKTRRTPAEPYSHDNMKLTCDGNITLLSAVPEVFEGTGAVPSGRPFSVRDLIRMLNVRITINQKDMTAVMFRDFKSE